MFHTTQMALMRTAEIAMPKQHSSGASGNILSGRKCVKTFSLCTIFLPHWYLFQPQRELSDKKTDQPFLGLTCEPSSNSTSPAKATWQTEHEFGRKIYDNQLHFPPISSSVTVTVQGSQVTALWCRKASGSFGT